MRERYRRSLIGGVLCLSCGRLGYDLTDVPGDMQEPRSDAGDAASGRTSAGDGGRAGFGGSPAGSGGGPGAGGRATFHRDAGGIVATGGIGGSTGGGGKGTVELDAATDVQDGAGRVPDGGGYPSCGLVSRQWSFGFESDPTLYDGDNDGVLDWVIRGGTPFPASELAGGVWRAATGKALDSRPMDDFSTRTILDVRFRSLTVPASHRGAVAWINVDEGSAAFSALFASVVLQPAGGQELTLFGKDGNTETPLAVFPDLPEGFIDLHLDIDPGVRTVGVWIGGVFRSTYSFPLTGVPNGDRFVTLLSWEGVSEFDAVTVRTCAP